MHKVSRSKRWIALAIAALLPGLALATGCGGDDESGDGDAEVADRENDQSAGDGDGDGDQGEGPEGCYDLSEHVCDCDTDQDGCAEAGGMWTEACECGTSGGGDGDGDDAGDPDPIFAIPTEVYGADFATSTSYIALVPSLDVDEISLDEAKELNGRASVARVGDYLFIAGSSEPVIHRYTIAEDGSLEEAGRLNFMNHGVPEFFSIDPWGAVFVDEHKAYIFNGNDGSHIIWDPTELEITGEIAGPDIIQEGYNLESIAVVRGSRMYRIFTFLNYDSWEFLAEPQYMAVYDLESDELIDLVEETRCPQLYSRPFVDEKGDIYFSGWAWTTALSLTSDYPTACALRIKDGEDTFDQDWRLDFAADITDGRQAAVLRYLGDGQALLDVFYDERAEIADDTDPQELAGTPNWRLWQVDLEAMTGGPVEGLDFKAGGYQDVQVGERTFLMVPNEDYSETTAYEVVDGQAVEIFKIQGSSYHMVQAR